MRRCETETRDIGCSGDADRLNESEKQDESAAEPANDSLAAGDITADSVKIHITYVRPSFIKQDQVRASFALLVMMP